MPTYWTKSWRQDRIFKHTFAVAFNKKPFWLRLAKIQYGYSNRKMDHLKKGERACL
jgi:hypothetical protein